MVKVSFFLRSNNDKQGNYVIYCRITVNSTKTEFSLCEKVTKKDWNQESQRMKSRDKEKENYVNALCSSIEYKIKSVCLVDGSEGLTASEIYERVKKKSCKPILLMDTVQKFIETTSIKMRTGTQKNHDVKLKNLIHFENFKKTKYTTSSFTISVAEDFINWFKLRCKTEHVETASRNVTFYKSALAHALKNGIIAKNELQHYNGCKDMAKKIVFLQKNEIESLINYAPKSITLQKVKDLFVFQIFTGLSFCDLQGNFEVKKNELGSYIVGKRIKNNLTFMTPLSSEAGKILDKYEMNLPKINNSLYNRTIKEIAALIGINEEITTHVARKTFATMKDSEGWSRETIAKMLGHSSTRTTEKHYLGDTIDRVVNEWQKKTTL